MNVLSSASSFAEQLMRFSRSGRITRCWDHESNRPLSDSISEPPLFCLMCGVTVHDPAQRDATHSFERRSSGGNDLTDCRS